MRLLLLFISITASFGQSTKEISYSNVTEHYKKTNQLKKLKAAEFLINNIDIHKSKNYKWKDEQNNDVIFSEFNYQDLDEALDAFKKLKDSIKIHPVKYTLADSVSLSSDLLIKNIDLAYKQWKENPWSQSYNFKTFCEYILPYRSLVEPLEDWREDYQFLAQNAIYKVNDESNPVDVAYQVVSGLEGFSFVRSRPDPIPVLSPKQMLFRRSGDCLDLANLSLLTCRSVGLAATIDFTPHYGASSNRHFWNTIIDKNGKHIPFNGGAFNNKNGLPGEYNAVAKRLAKVFRRTFSAQPTALTALIPDNQIPESFLKEENIIDVTSEYVSTTDFKYINSSWKDSVAYVNVFNLTKWRMVDWGIKTIDGYTFKNLGTNIVYLPSVYNSIEQKMVYANYPILINTKKEKHELKPNYKKSQTYLFNKENSIVNPYKDFNALDIQNNEIYHIFVWDKTWQKISTGKAVGKNITFNNIPENGLFWIVTKDSYKFQRIFIIDKNTQKIVWY